MNSGRIMKGCSLLCVILLVSGIFYLLFSTIEAQYRIPETLPNAVEAPGFDSRIPNEEPPFWFVQISDLHLSKFNVDNPDRDLKKFFSFMNSKISPGAVIVTGDLTDAKTPYGFGSEQLDVEWRLYSRTMSDFNYTHFLDIRGNHDTFDVPSVEHPRNYFDDYSVQGQSGNSRSYLRVITVGSKRYGFIAVDATPIPGPKRPFNFIGIVDQETMDHVKELAEKAANECDYVFWFGHYPTSSIYSVSPGIRNIMASQGFVYVSGHFHTLHNFVTKMYSRQSSGLLELELGDWKDNRVFRILTVDRDMFSFGDFRYNPDEEARPYVVMLQPKDPSYVLPSKEPVLKSIEQIRVLIFGDVSADVVAVIEHGISGDKTLVPLHRQDKGRPIFVGNWSSGPEFKMGAHSITIRANNSQNEEFLTTQTFSLDGSGKHFGIVARLMLMSNIVTLTQLISGIFTFSLTLILCLARALSYQRNNLRWLKNRTSCFTTQLDNLLLMSTHGDLVFPLIIYIIYVQFGPWSFGYFLSDRFGVLFAWGMFIDGAFLPADTTYLFTIFHALLCEIPLVILVSNSLVRERSTRFFLFLYGESGWLLYMLVQFAHIILFYSSYGLLAALGPIRIGTLIFSGYLWLRATTLSFSKIRK